MTAVGRAVGAADAGFAQGPGGRWTVSGPLTCANAGAAFAAAGAMPLPVAGEIDLGQVGAVDSAVVAVLLALKRRAADEGRSLAFVNVPAAIGALARLYGVEELVAA